MSDDDNDKVDAIVDQLVSRAGGRYEEVVIVAMRELMKVCEDPVRSRIEALTTFVVTAAWRQGIPDSCSLESSRSWPAISTSMCGTS